MKHLYFCRHGQTRANASGHWSGTLETPLTETGKQQAKHAGLSAKDFGIDYIICSPLGRAKDTAKIVAKEIGFPINKIEHNSLFIERHFGQMEGQPYHSDHDVDGFIDVEAKDSVLERAHLAYEHLQTIDAENILIVSHGTFGRAFRSITHSHLPFESKGTDETRFKNAEIVQLI